MRRTPFRPQLGGNSVPATSQTATSRDSFLDVATSQPRICSINLSIEQSEQDSIEGGRKPTFDVLPEKVLPRITNPAFPSCDSTSSLEREVSGSSAVVTPSPSGMASPRPCPIKSWAEAAASVTPAAAAVPAVVLGGGAVAAVGPPDESQPRRDLRTSSAAGAPSANVAAETPAVKGLSCATTRGRRTGRILASTFGSAPTVPKASTPAPASATPPSAAPPSPSSGTPTAVLSPREHRVASNQFASGNAFSFGPAQGGGLNATPFGSSQTPPRPDSTSPRTQSTFQGMAMGAVCSERTPRVSTEPATRVQSYSSMAATGLSSPTAGADAKPPTSAPPSNRPKRITTFQAKKFIMSAIKGKSSSNAGTPTSTHSRSHTAMEDIAKRDSMERESQMVSRRSFTETDSIHPSFMKATETDFCSQAESLDSNLCALTAVDIMALADRYGWTVARSLNSELGAGAGGDEEPKAASFGPGNATDAGPGLDIRTPDRHDSLKGKKHPGRAVGLLLCDRMHSGRTGKEIIRTLRALAKGRGESRMTIIAVLMDTQSDEVAIEHIITEQRRLRKLGVDDVLTNKRSAAELRLAVEMSRANSEARHEEIMRLKEDSMMLHEKLQEAREQEPPMGFFWQSAHRGFNGFPAVDPEILCEPEPGAVVGPCELGQTIGGGAFSVCFKAMNAESGRTEAIKVVPKDRMRKMEHVVGLWREITLLQQLQHPHIVKVYESYHGPHHIFVRMEVAGSSNLFQAIKQSKGRLDLDSAQAIAAQLTSAIDHCHERGIAHRDLKPENIAFSNSRDGCRIKVIDFGCVASLRSWRHELVGTLPFIAPEVLIACRSTPYMASFADIWSLAVIFLELLCGIDKFNKMMQWDRKTQPNEKCADRIQEFFVNADDARGRERPRTPAGEQPGRAISASICDLSDRVKKATAQALITSQDLQPIAASDRKPRRPSLSLPSAKRGSPLEQAVREDLAEPPADVLDVLEAMFNLDPDQRPHASDLLECEWLSGYEPP